MFRFTVTLAALAVGCAGYAVPVQRVADAESAASAARVMGADSVPRAKLHLELANEEIARAQHLIAREKNERADYELRRARADGELALAEAREARAKRAAEEVLHEISDLKEQP